MQVERLIHREAARTYAAATGAVRRTRGVSPYPSQQHHEDDDEQSSRVHFLLPYGSRIIRHPTSGEHEPASVLLRTPLPHRGLRRPVLPPRPLPLGLGDAGCGGSIHPVHRSRARRRRADPGQSRGPRRVDWSFDAADEVALAMLAHLIDDLPIAMEITAARMQAVELVSLVSDRKFSVVCFADLPPSSSSKTRYLVRRLRSTLPELRIAVGRWAPPALADESSQTLLDAGADHVASLLIESRNYFGGLLEMPRLPISGTADAAGLAAPPVSIGRGSA
jgi:hypothetical protein